MRAMAICSVCAIVVVVCISGCATKTQTSSEFIESSAERHFKQNPLLDNEEKAYALRMWKWMVSDSYIKLHPEHVKYADEFVIDRNLLNTDLYAKWGIGKTLYFSTSEKLYITSIPIINGRWTEYRNAQPNERGKKFLKEMHNKYGPSPINAIEVVKKEYGADINENSIQTILELFEVITGSLELDDKGWLLMNKLIVEQSGYWEQPPPLY